MKAATIHRLNDNIFYIFQSTPPVKAATVTSATLKGITKISIHAAREGGDVMEDLLWTYEHGFQSTPPVKAATTIARRTARASRFQSTPPVKAATSVAYAVRVPFSISIHAAREGGDHL